jgi:rare lipoprotein A
MYPTDGNSRRLWLIMTALAAAGLSACSSSDVRNLPETGSARSVIDPMRSSRGNPPFYEVHGKRYYVLATSDGFNERGVASWYGPKFHGKPTSGGEIYDMHAMTAAHKTLPIPTWVEVTNLANGKQVIVKVNDRGPFVDDRVIDLSYRAANELDMIAKGTARVRIRALGAPVMEGPPALLARTGEAEAPRRGFSLISEAQAGTLSDHGLAADELYVQVGAFSDRNNATNLVARLRRSGFPDTFLIAATDSRTPLYRVRIGPLEDADHFDRVTARLRSVGVQEARLVVDN